MKPPAKIRLDRLSWLIQFYSMTFAPPGKPFKLKSGGTSPYFINGKALTLRSDGCYEASQRMLDVLISKDEPFGKVDAVAGVALGGCPLATGVSLAAMTVGTGWMLPALYVRPERKDHGTEQLVEGPFQKGQRVVLLEDVVTTGGSSLRAIKALESEGLTIAGVMALVDRGQGGKEAFEAAGYAYCPLLDVKDLLQGEIVAAKLRQSGGEDGSDK